MIEYKKTKEAFYEKKLSLYIDLNPDILKNMQNG